MALVSATASFLGILFSLPKMLGSASESLNLNVYGFGTYALLFLVVISVTLLFIAILAIISAYAKSVKEASSLSLPVMILVMLIGVSGFMSSGAATNPVYYLIPVYNAVQSLTAILSGNVNSLCLGVAIISNICYVTIIVILLARMLNSERIMFKK
jgi:sodium transport system permease protein